MERISAQKESSKGFAQVCGTADQGPRQQQQARRMRALALLPMVQLALLLLAAPVALSMATEPPTDAPATWVPSVKPSAKPSVKPTIAPTAGYTTRRIAGTGAQGFYGDGGLATLAKLSNPDSTVVDEFQNVYISDAANSRVRMVNNANGIINTYAGGGLNAGSVVGAATSAQFSSVKGIIASPSSNELLLADSNGQRVVGINLATREVRTVLKTVVTDCPANVVDFSATASSLARVPRKLWLDSSDNLYVTNECSTVVKVSQSTGKANVVLGKSLLFTANTEYSDSMLSFDPTAATSVQLHSPRGVWGDSTGSLFNTFVRYFSRIE